MSLFNISAPDQGAILSLVSPGDVREALRIGEDEAAAEANTIERMIQAAYQHLDGRDGILGRAILPQRWKLTLPCFPERPIALPLGQTRAVLALAYRNSTGQVTMQPADYRVRNLGGADGAEILPAASWWPSTAFDPEAVSVDFECGFDSDKVPAPIVQAITLLTAHWYGQREAVVITTAQAQPIPFGFAELVAPFKRWAF